MVCSDEQVENVVLTCSDDVMSPGWVLVTAFIPLTYSGICVAVGIAIVVVALALFVVIWLIMFIMVTIIAIVTTVFLIFAVQR